MKKIYLDTNQLYYIRRIAEESQGAEFGNYESTGRVRSSFVAYFPYFLLDSQRGQTAED